MSKGETIVKVTAIVCITAMGITGLIFLGKKFATI